MVHIEAQQFVEYAKTQLPHHFKEVVVLDVGSGDINGNNRYLFEDSKYVGNDVAEHANVDFVCRTKDLPFEDERFDTIVSTECFEHDPEYKQSILKIIQMLKKGGLFVFTCASTGRPEHGTRRTTQNDNVGCINHLEDMQDYYKNLTIEDIQEFVDLDEVFIYWRSYYNPKTCDLYFLGVKKDDELIEPVLAEYAIVNYVKPKPVQEEEIFCNQVISDQVIETDTELGNEDLVNMFGDYVLYNQEEFSKQFNVKDFNYDVFDEEYYANKFPHFAPEVHELLSTMSRNKIIDLRKENDMFKSVQGQFHPFKEDNKDIMVNNEENIIL